MQFKDIFSEVTTISPTTSEIIAVDYQLFTAGLTPAGTWITKVNTEALDQFLYTRAGNKIISKYVTNELYTASEVIDYPAIARNNIKHILNTYAYMLDGLADSMLFDYEPLVNYDKVETQTHNETVNTDDHTTNVSVGARSQTNNNGAKTDTNSASTTAFDSSDYAKGTDRNTNVSGASTDTITTNATVDSTTEQGYQDTSNGGYTLTIKGNIGVTTSQQMLEAERKVREFNFYEKVLDIFYKEILDFNWEV